MDTIPAWPGPAAGGAGVPRVRQPLVSLRAGGQVQRGEVEGGLLQVGLGPARATTLCPLGHLVRAGVPLALHSDFTMAPARPLALVWAAVNRVTAETGRCNHPELRLPTYTALRGGPLPCHPCRGDRRGRGGARPRGHPGQPHPRQGGQPGPARQEPHGCAAHGHQRHHSCCYSVPRKVQPDSKKIANQKVTLKLHPHKLARKL